MILCVLRRLPVSAILALAVLAAVTCTAHAKMAWPSRSTPLHSTLGWFKAINARRRSRLLFYVAPGARSMMAWAQPTVAWSKFTDLRHTNAGWLIDNYGQG